MTLPAAAGPTPGPAALRALDLTKSFAGTRALVGVSLEVRPGEIHALVGGNGSGKSTLIKILAGVERAEPGGTLEVHGVTARADHWSPEQAHAAGLRFVHQNPGLFRQLTVAENLAFGPGFPTAPGGRIRWSVLRRRAADLIERYGIRAAPTTPVGALPAADRTLVAIARALQPPFAATESTVDGPAPILVLDEPTTALPAAEVEVLLTALRGYAAAGQTIVFVSHRIDEVLASADRVTALRDGRRIATLDAELATEPHLVELIAGRPAGPPAVGGVPVAAADAPLLEFRGIAGGPLSGVDLAVRAGEVVGLAGLLGAGRSELLRMAFGDLAPATGEVLVDGRPERFRGPAAAMAAGVGYLPEDRATQAAFPSMSVRQNISGGQLRRYWRRLRLQHRTERADALAAMREFGIRAASDRAPLSTLSGGNQQKVVLARPLRTRPRVLLLDEPTQGVDVGAREEIHRLIARAAADGAGVLMVANDLAELALVCSRVAVLRAGRIVAELSGPDIDPHQLARLAHLKEGAA